jgi:signal transduction histidine kinase
VQGEDEVAQLQANFNAMAADLERGVHDLRAERDNVALLLTQRRELIASVSHELRTPVATLRGYLESASLRWNDATPDALRHDVDVMLHETQRLQTLIDDLFTLAQAEVGRLDLRCEPTDLGELARRAVETVAPLAWRSARVEVVARVTPGLPAAQIDSIRTEQALHNLLRNALRHTPPGGIIAVVAERAGERLALRVRDTGEGISADDLPHIWERFYRSNGARASDANGSGLGLALVKEVVEAMGGAVTVESEPGAGSVFSLLLPLAAESATPDAPPQTVAAS